MATISPVRDSARVNEKLSVWDLRIPQGQRCKLAVLAIAAIAVDDDYLGGLAQGENCAHVILRMIIVELISAGNVTSLVMLVVAGIYENDCPLLVKWIMEQFLRLFSIDNLEALFFEPLNYWVLHRIGAGGDNSGPVGFCPRDWKRFAMEIVLCQSEAAGGKSVGRERDDCTDRCDDESFE